MKGALKLQPRLESLRLGGCTQGIKLVTETRRKSLISNLCQSGAEVIKMETEDASEARTSSRSAFNRRVATLQNKLRDKICRPPRGFAKRDA